MEVDVADVYLRVVLSPLLERRFDQYIQISSRPLISISNKPNQI